MKESDVEIADLVEIFSGAKEMFPGGVVASVKRQPRAASKPETSRKVGDLCSFPLSII